MPTILPYGFVPVEIYYEKSNLPPLTIVEGDYQTRGYQVTFFNSAGDEIVHTDTQSARCYAVNPKVSEDSYYTEGQYQDGHWYLWVPSKTLTVAGTVQIQIILYEGDQQLIHTRVCKVRITPSIAQNAITNPDDGESGPLPKSVLESIQKMIKGSIDEEVRPLKEEQSKFATKEEVSKFATKQDVDSKLAGMASKDHDHKEYLTVTNASEVYQTKEDMNVYATKEDLEKVGSAGYLYMLAAIDTMASQECLDKLKGYERIEDIIKDRQAFDAITNSPVAMQVIANSWTAMFAIAQNEVAINSLFGKRTSRTEVEKSEVAIEELLRSQYGFAAITRDQDLLRSWLCLPNTSNCLANSEKMLNYLSNDRMFMSTLRLYPEFVRKIQKNPKVKEIFSKSTRVSTLKANTTISGNFTPLWASSNDERISAYNSESESWSFVGEEFGDWILRNPKRTASKLKAYSEDLYVTYTT